MPNKYSPEKIFNMVMDYIDECIFQQMSTPDINKTMWKETGIHFSEFNTILRVLNYTYPSLSKYIPFRRACLALDHAIKNPNQSMQSIANFFGMQIHQYFPEKSKNILVSRQAMLASKSLTTMITSFRLQIMKRKCQRTMIRRKTI